MWTKLAHNVLKFRLLVIILLGLITVYMAYRAKSVEYSYSLAKIVPSDDPEMVYFEEFKSLFGEDGNIVALGIKDSSLYQLDNFRRFSYLTNSISGINGVKQVISISNINRFSKDEESKTFVLDPIFKTFPDTQEKLDSLLGIVQDQKFYSEQLINPNNGATFIMVSIDREVLNTKYRDVTINDIKHDGEKFEEITGIDIHYVGLPYIRSDVNGKIKDELQTFLILSLILAALILLFFFRSWDAVIFPIIIVLTVVVWSLGTLAIFNYKITMVTGLLPPIITVIGIPNCIYLLNKYHQEISKHGNKARALSFVIRKIGLVTFITNFTTAIGFLVLVFTNITILKEFGLVASINIMAAFLVSITLIPAVFSYLPTPQGKQLRHLKFRFVEKILTNLDLLVHRQRYTVFTVTAVITVIALIGIFKLGSVSFMVDDVPEDSPVKKDLVFFENNFSGIMPMEIIFDTNKKKGALNLGNLKKIQKLEDYLSESEYISRPVSLVDIFKAANQAFWNNNPNFYRLPNKRESRFLLSYLKNQNDSTKVINAFMDTTQQIVRSSFKVADIGSNKLDSLLNNVVKAKINDIFYTGEGDHNIDVKVTGSTLLFVKGNSFLVKNLRMSLLLAFIIIALIMGVLFRNFKMIIISLAPNVVPLAITAGIMGYMGIPLRPSTALIFCVTFGIAVDDSIHFLAKYRQELFANNFFVPIAISKSIRETGASMMYTSIVLFFGFVIFSWSDFRGTMTLGLLTSTTLLVAMFTNLIVLPSLLMAFDDGKRDKEHHPPIEHYDDFYQEDEDEEIDLKLISLNGENGKSEEEIIEQKNNIVN